MNLVIKLILGIASGIVLGFVLPTPLVRVLITFKDLFGELIGFAIPFIILLYITHGIAGLGHKSGRIVGVTVALTYVSTFMAALMAATVGLSILPSIAHQVVMGGASEALKPYFVISIDPIMSVMTALMTAFLFGIGISKTHSHTLEHAALEGKHIMDGLLSHIIVPFLPIYVGCIFAGLANDGSVSETLKTFVFVLALAITLHWVWLCVLYAIAGIVTGRNPFILLKNMLPAYMTALGTMSSTATIPVTLRSVRENKISAPVADFGVPLCATIHICGSVITITTCSIAVMMITPGYVAPDLMGLIPFICMLGLIMIAAPGIPGGGVMASLGLLTSMLAFNETAIGLMIALYVAQDSFGTAANVTGDGAILAIVDKWVGKHV